MNDNSELHELHLIESNLQNILMQKQTLYLELNEVSNALAEVEKSSGDIYKVAGQIMLKADKNQVIKDLQEKKHLLELRNSSIEKQEALLESKANELKKELHKSQNKTNS